MSREVKCKCGQVNHLVDIGGVECYDRDKHGKVEDHPADGKCVNCHAVFGPSDAEKAVARAEAEKKAKAAAAKKAKADADALEDPDAGADPDADPEGDLDDLTIPQLKEVAAERQIEIPKDVRKKADIVALIEMSDEQTE